MKNFILLLVLGILGTSCTLNKGVVAHRSPIEFRDNRNIPDEAFVIIHQNNDFIHAYDIAVQNDTIYFKYTTAGSRQEKIARKLALSGQKLSPNEYNESTIQKMVVVSTQHLRVLEDKRAAIYVDDIRHVRLGSEIERSNSLIYAITLGSVLVASIPWLFLVQILN